jgi:hypothetical protein
MKTFIAFAPTIGTRRVRHDAVMIVFAGSTETNAHMTALEEIQGDLNV